MHRMRTGVVVLGLSVLVAGCGTRLPDSAFVSSGGEVVVDDQGAPLPGDAVDDGGTDDTLPGDEVDGSQSTLPSSSGGDDGGTVDGGSATATTLPDDGGSQDDGPNQASDLGVTATEIMIGNITAVNGVLGDAFAPSQRGLQALVANVNAQRRRPRPQDHPRDVRRPRGPRQRPRLRAQARRAGQGVRARRQQHPRRWAARRSTSTTRACRLLRHPDHDGVLPLPALLDAEYGSRLRPRRQDRRLQRQAHTARPGSTAGSRRTSA